MADNEPAMRDLRTIAPRDTHREVELSRAHSNAVGILRWALPALALSVLGLLIVWPMFDASKLSSNIADHIPNLVVENLHLTGMDSNDQPYTLTAARALHTVNEKNMLDLEKPQGDIALTDGTWLAGKADFGRYDSETKHLWLKGDVEIFHDQGYQFRTQAAQIDVDQSSAQGDSPVWLQGSFGQIEGKGFNLSNQGDLVVIQGPARAQLHLRPPPASGTKAPSGTKASVTPKTKGAKQK